MSDTDDLVRLANAYGVVTRCDGGRLIHADYCCLHCGHDTTDGGCKKPTKARRLQMTRDKDGVWREWEL